MSNIIFVIIFVFFCVFMGKILYLGVSLKENKIKISKKFILNVNNDKIYKVFDNHKVEYVIGGSFTSDKRKEILWNSLTEGETFMIKYYGFDLPNFGISYTLMEVL